MFLYCSTAINLDEQSSYSSSTKIDSEEIKIYNLTLGFRISVFLQGSFAHYNRSIELGKIIMLWLVKYLWNLIHLFSYKFF